MTTTTALIIAIAIALGIVALGIWTPKWLSDLGAAAASARRN